MTKKLLLTGAYSYSKEQLDKIEQLGWNITFVQNELEALDIDVREFDAVVCNALFLYNDISEFHNLKMVQATSAGLERLPVEYMKKHNILYYNARGVYSIPIAEWVVMSILEIYKNARDFFRKQENHRWEKDRSLLELAGKKVCIVGYGNIGQEIAKRLSAFGTEITAVNRSQVEDPYVCTWIPLKRIDEVLFKSDIIILSIALTKETTNLMNTDRISHLKKGSMLINISRGEVLDEEALIVQLKNKRFKGVALDVFKKEPLPADSAFWKDDRVIIGPHNSFVGEHVRDRMFEVIYNNLRNMKL